MPDLDSKTAPFWSSTFSYSTKTITMWFINSTNSNNLDFWITPFIVFIMVQHQTKTVTFDLTALNLNTFFLFTAPNVVMHLMTTPPKKHSIHEHQRTKKVVFQSSTNLWDLTSTTAPYRINKFSYSTPEKTLTFFNSTKRILSNNLTGPYFIFISEQHITVTLSCCHSNKLKNNNFNNSTKLGYSS